MQRPAKDGKGHRGRCNDADRAIPERGAGESGSHPVCTGRKNHIEIEINGAKGSLYFDFEDMNR